MLQRNIYNILIETPAQFSYFHSISFFFTFPGKGNILSSYIGPINGASAAICPLIGKLMDSFFKIKSLKKKKSSLLDCLLASLQLGSYGLFRKIGVV